MAHTFPKLALGIAVAILASQPEAFAGRGGGYRGGGGGGYHGGGGSPSFSQPHSTGNQSGMHSPYGNSSSAANHPAGAAAAGAGHANNNQSLNHPGAAGAAAGAGYANNNQSLNHPGAAGAAAGAGYANNHNMYDQYHPGMVNGYSNGSGYGAWGATGYGSGVGAWGAGSPMYGWGYSGYSNPYSGGMAASGVGTQTAVNQPGNAAQASTSAGYDYSQPISTTAPPPDQPVAGQASSAFGDARAAFKAGDYAKALQLEQQALTQMPNDRTMHEFLNLVLFAQGKYDQAAEPLYAVLSAGPGWDWTTLSGMYPDFDTYTVQLRALEAAVRANPDSAPAHFELAYQYLAQGHIENAVAQLKETVKLKPGDTISAQLIASLQPSAGSAPPSPEVAPAAAGKLAGSWTATPAKDVKIALAIKDDGQFDWQATGPGKPPITIDGASSVTDGVLTLAAKGGKDGALTGKIAWQDADHFTFQLVGAPANDPGLKFAR